jgi:hypothetical protein
VKDVVGAMTVERFCAALGDVARPELVHDFERLCSTV